MEEQNDIKFEESQYLGRNTYSVIRRTLLAIFCFIAYYMADHETLNPEIIKPLETIHSNPQEIFFMMGMAVLVISTILAYVLHIKTTVTSESIILDGLWTARKVKINLSSIVSVKKIKLKKYVFRRPVYNLHRKGKIKFYTSGGHIIELIDKDGLKYIIGSQRYNELHFIISSLIKK